MTNSEIVEQLHREHRDRTINQFSIDAESRELLMRMVDESIEIAGFRAKRSASTLFKLIPAESGNGADSAKYEAHKRPTSDSVTTPKVHIPPESFSFFRNSNSPNAAGNYTIEALTRKIRTEDNWKDKAEQIRNTEDENLRKELKKKLPGFTASICLKDSRGVRRGVTESKYTHTNLIQADFDEHDDFDTLAARLKQDKHMRLVFRSPSNKVKALIRVQPVTTEAEHHAAFLAVEAYCKEQGYGQIDKLPKKANALCFISHDPDALLKDAEPLPWELQRTTASQAEKPHKQRSNAGDLQSALDAIPADDYDEWVEVGMALRHEGKAFPLWDTWSQKSSKYNQSHDQMRKKWESFRSGGNNSRGLGSIYHLAKEYGWTPPRREQTDPRTRLHYRGRAARGTRRR